MLGLISGAIPAGVCTERFSVRRGTSPLVVSMPHGGTGVPDAIRDRMRSGARELPDTDWGIPELYDFVGTGSGDVGEWRAEGGSDPDALAHASVIEAHCSRYLIDLNRDPTGGSLYPGRATTELVPLVQFDGTPIWRDGEEPDSEEVEERRARWFDPYHAALGRLLRTTVHRHGYAVLWDAHSIRSRVPRLFDGRLPDLNLGTNSGESCDAAVREAVAEAMGAQERYTTVVDGRFTGGWITRRYGRPDRRIHALQMEIALSAYMEESDPWTLDPARAVPLRDTLKTIMTAAVDAAAALQEGAHR